MQTKPKERYDTRESRILLSKVFDLPFSDQMQDWPWEVADPKSIQKYLDYYQSINDQNVKFTLMEIIIQAIEDQENLEKLKFYWEKTAPILIENFDIHEWTIYYWSSVGVVLAEAWSIAPYMRSIWRSRNAFK
jgi:hypothetical protein